MQMIGLRCDDVARRAMRLFPDAPGARCVEQGDEGVAGGFWINAGDQSVDWLYIYRVVVQIDQFDHGVSGRMLC